MNEITLLTGFEPFGEYVVNSSWEGSRIVGERMPEQVRAVRLPVDYMAARERLIEHMTQQKPTICLCTGLTSSPMFGIECVARKPEQFSALEGPEVLEGAWDWHEIARELRASECTAAVSYDAGQYVCESTYWALLEFRRVNGYPKYAAFIHVPPLSANNTAVKIARALERVIQIRLDNIAATEEPLMSPTALPLMPG